MTFGRGRRWGVAATVAAAVIAIPATAAHRDGDRIVLEGVGGGRHEIKSEPLEAR